MSEDQEVEFKALLQTETYKGVNAVRTTTFEKGKEEGIEKGRHQTLLSSIENYLELKYVTEGRQFFQRLPNSLDSGKLEALLKAAHSSNNLDALGKVLS